MKQLIFLEQVTIFFIVFSMNISVMATDSITHKFHESRIITNSISGQVYDPYNQPISELDVELLNENYSTIARSRTRAGGRFSFNGLSSGNFKVKVLTLGTDYLEQIQDVQIVNVFQGGSDQQYIDFYLKFDPRKITIDINSSSEEIFVQEEITNEARKHYKKGAELLASKNDKGLIEIEQALQIFPDYYDALNRLGREYVLRREYQKSLPYLIKAIDVNQRSFSGFYALGYACYQLRRIPEAIQATRAAAIINPSSVNAQLLYGTILRISGNYQAAEKALLQAKKLSKKPILETHWQLALLYNKMGRNKEAAEELKTYLKIQPNSPNKKEIQDLIAKLDSQAQ